MSNFVSISNARNNLPRLVDQVNKNMDRITITVHGQPTATLINTEELESIEETNEILSIPGALESIKKGREQIRKGQFVKLEDLK